MAAWSTSIRRNRSLNKTLLAFHRTHDFRSNGTLEMPFGPGPKFLNTAPGIVSRIVERWQLGAFSAGVPVRLYTYRSGCGAYLDTNAANG